MSTSVPKPVKKVPIHLQSAQTRLLIKGGKIVNDDHIFDSDIYVEDGIIKQMGRDLIIPGGSRIIEAKGKLIIPGGIDTHTHFELSFLNNKSVDDFYSGTKAALAGGTTMIMDVVLDPGSNSLVDAFDKWRAMADEKVCCDYGLHVCIPAWNDKIPSQMETLVKEKGVNSFLAYLNYKDALMLRDDELIKFFESCKSLGALAQVHAENGDIIHWNEKQLIKQGITGPEGYVRSRPEEIEAEAAHRAIVLANNVNCPLYIVTVTSKSAANIIATKRNQGNLVFGECFAAALAVTGECYLNDDKEIALEHICSPPLRSDPTTPVALLDSLSSGNLHVVASTNLTFSKQQKLTGISDFTKIPPGVNGVEDRMSLIWELGVISGKISPSQFVAITSTNAAKIFNLYPRKGRIQVGSDADLVIWDPIKTHTISGKTHHQNVDYNIFEGIKCHGVPLYVISQGRIVLEEGQLHVCQGVGRFISMPPFAPYAFCCSLEREKIKIEKVERKDGPATKKEDPVTPVKAAINSGNFLDAGVKTNGHFEDHVLDGDIRSRPLTPSGTRHLQDSSFSISGAQIDDRLVGKPNIRVHNPPGGKSTALW